MSKTLSAITNLIQKGEVLISVHGYDELAADNLSAKEIMEGVNKAVLVEDYPDFHKGPAVLVFQVDKRGNPVHVVWGISKATTTPAVLVTAYRPDPDRWSDDFLRRLG